MNKKWLIALSMIVIISVGAIGFSVGERTINIKQTFEGANDDYVVEVEGYEGIGISFDFNSVDVKTIKEEIRNRLDTIDDIKAYDLRVKSGLGGCSTTAECHEWGWLDDTVCYRGRCWDADKTSQIDAELDDTNWDTKKNELDTALTGVVKP